MRIRNKIAKKIAEDRILRLLDLGEEWQGKQPVRRNLELAKKIALRHRVKLPRRLKRAICKKCGIQLIPGKTSITRIRKERIITTCRNCGHVARIPVTKKKGNGNE